MKPSIKLSANTLRLLDQLKRSDLPSLGAPEGLAQLSPGEISARLDALADEWGCCHEQLVLLKAAALFWHDHLEASHEISQCIHSPEGSFLHGMMHRREPDWPNAKYWFHRVGDHPLYGLLADRLKGLEGGQELEEHPVIRNDKWDPIAFVDRIEEHFQNRPGALPPTQLMSIQQVEFETLIEWILNAYQV